MCFSVSSCNITKTVLTEIAAYIWHTKDGFEEIFKAHYQALCAFAFGVVSDADMSEEIVQDVFVKLWTNKNEIEITKSVKSYLYKAVRNSSLNAIKHLKVKEEYKRHNKIERDKAECTLSDDLVENELDRQIKAAIDHLPTERKKIFLLSRNEGLKYKEIAEKLGISVKTVENQMGKALAMLREELAEYLPAVLIAIILGIR